MFVVFPTLYLYPFDTMLKIHQEIINGIKGVEFKNTFLGASAEFFYLSYMTILVPIVICILAIATAWVGRTVLAIGRRPIISVHAFVTQQGEVGSDAADRAVAATFALFAAGLIFWATV